MKHSLREVAEAVHARLIGEGHTEITGVSSLESASHDDLVFVDDEKHFAAALKSRAGAILAGEFAAWENSGRPLLISDHPKLAFARAAQLFGQEPPSSDGEQASLHPTAVVPE